MVAMVMRINEVFKGFIAQFFQFFYNMWSRSWKLCIYHYESIACIEPAYSAALLGKYTYVIAQRLKVIRP
ncbi:hypothetical protein D3C73_1409860 [compost metagenome]